MLCPQMDMKKGSWPQTVGKAGSYSFPQNQQKTSCSISYACTLESLLPVHLLCIIWAPKEMNTSHHHITLWSPAKKQMGASSALGSSSFTFTAVPGAAPTHQMHHMMPAIPKLSYASRHVLFLEFKKCRHVCLLPHKGILIQWFGRRIP